MKVSDLKADPAAGFVRNKVVVPANPAVSLTDRLIGCLKPGYGFQVTDVAAYCATKAGTVTLSTMICPALAGIISAPVVTVHSTPEQLAVALFRARANGVFVEKAAATGITFSAAHVVTASKFGVILLQMNSSGTISSKVPSSTQAYDTAADALAALPAADSDKVAIAYIQIANNAGDWTANTDDLTNGSDLTTATITNATAIPRLHATAITPVAATRVVATLSTTLANLQGSRTDDILVLATTDGSGALTGGGVEITFRPAPAHGEVVGE